MCTLIFLWPHFNVLANASLLIVFSYLCRTFCAHHFHSSIPLRASCEHSFLRQCQATEMSPSSVIVFLFSSYILELCFVSPTLTLVFFLQPLHSTFYSYLRVLFYIYFYYECRGGKKVNTKEKDVTETSDIRYVLRPRKRLNEGSPIVVHG